MDISHSYTSCTRSYGANFAIIDQRSFLEEYNWRNMLGMLLERLFYKNRAAHNASESIFHIYRWDRLNRDMIDVLFSWRIRRYSSGRFNRDWVWCSSYKASLILLSSVSILFSADMINSSISFIRLWTVITSSGITGLWAETLTESCFSVKIRS